MATTLLSGHGELAAARDACGNERRDSRTQTRQESSRDWLRRGRPPTEVEKTRTESSSQVRQPPRRAQSRHRPARAARLEREAPCRLPDYGLGGIQAQAVPGARPNLRASRTVFLTSSAGTISANTLPCEKAVKQEGGRERQPAAQQRGIAAGRGRATTGP